MVAVRCLRLDELEEAYRIQAEYLDEQPYGTWADCYGRSPEFFIGSFAAGRLVGIAYGKPSPRAPADLQLSGIAVVEAHWRQGYGSRLLRFFERQAAKAGYASVSLGSARGYVERFYLKNGYAPTAFAFWVAADYRLSPKLRAQYGIEGDPQKDGGRLAVGIRTLDEKLRAELEAEFAGTEVIAILAKIFPG